MKISKLKTGVIIAIIILILLFIIAFFEFIVLRLLGFEYDSIHSLVSFFVLYTLLEIPLSLFLDALPKALKSLGMIKSSKGWLPFVLDTCLTFLLITLLDFFMAGIKIGLTD